MGLAEQAFAIFVKHSYLPGGPFECGMQQYLEELREREDHEVEAYTKALMCRPAESEPEPEPEYDDFSPNTCFLCGKVGGVSSLGTCGRC